MYLQVSHLSKNVITLRERGSSFPVSNALDTKAADTETRKCGQYTVSLTFCARTVLHPSLQGILDIQSVLTFSPEQIGVLLVLKKK